jgi:hypothetical protein
VSQPICTATTASGKPCRNRAMEGATLCASHLGVARGPDPPVTDELIEALVAMLRAGNLVPVAARAAGVARSTLYAWLDMAGRPGASPKLVELRQRVERARAEGQVRLVAQIATAASSDWRAAAWLLARGYPDEWAQYASSSGETTTTDATPERPDPFAELDELAAKRQARAR